MSRRCVVVMQKDQSRHDLDRRSMAEGFNGGWNDGSERGGTEGEDDQKLNLGSQASRQPKH